MNQHLAVITGCSSGFGLLSTIELARKDYFVVATMRDLARRAPLDEALASAGLTGQVSVRTLDVAVPESHEPFVAQTVADYGRIDLLVNNAGFALAGFAEDVTLEELRRQFETNFFGTVSLTKAVLPVMRRQGAGRILMLSSISGRSANPVLSSYSSSKFALEGYTESLRLEMKPLGIDCILIEPGSYRDRNLVSQRQCCRRRIRSRLSQLRAHQKVPCVYRREAATPRCRRGRPPDRSSRRRSPSPPSLPHRTGRQGYRRAARPIAIETLRGHDCPCAALGQMRKGQVRNVK